MLTAISLFASGGIGDLALRANGIKIILANEILDDRVQVFRKNFPETVSIQGDILTQKENIVLTTLELLQGQELDILYATPPCQGMSKNGRGKLLNNVRKGLRPKLDERNQLIIPVVEIAMSLRPRLIFLENVPEMQNTIIRTPGGKYKTIIDYLKNQLSNDYLGSAQIVEFADYGVPQKRQRLITVYTREKKALSYFEAVGSLLPHKTHSARGERGTKRWVTLRDTISNIPSLDAKNVTNARSDIPFHRVPILDESKYLWVSNTPPEKSAFDNQCVACGFDKNPIHGSRIGRDGINRSRTDTPIRCQRCNAVLPRPWVMKKGEPRLMKGFTSAYRRMRWDGPSNALTTNLSYACSDSKLHPDQNRVLSLYEAFRLHTITDFQYLWERADGKKISDKTIREIIGESIPPRGLSIIMNHITKILMLSDTGDIPVPATRQKQRVSVSIREDDRERIWHLLRKAMNA